MVDATTEKSYNGFVMYEYPKTISDCIEFMVEAIKRHMNESDSTMIDSRAFYSCLERDEEENTAIMLAVYYRVGNPVFKYIAESSLKPRLAIHAMQQLKELKKGSKFFRIMVYKPSGKVLSAKKVEMAGFGNMEFKDRQSAKAKLVQILYAFAGSGYSYKIEKFYKAS